MSEYKLVIKKNPAIPEFPNNPLKEKWKKEYPPKPMPQYSQVCDGYSCMWCGRCPHGDYWECPEEDKEVYEQYQQEVKQYIDKYGDRLFVLDQQEVKQYIDKYGDQLFVLGD